MGRPKSSKQTQEEYTPTALPPNHLLVQLGVPKGSNNFQCIDVNSVERLVEIGQKIRKQVLATRGDFAIVSLFPLGPSGKEEKAGALVGEVIYVASNKDVKDWKKAGEWPEGFGDAPKTRPEETVHDEEDEEDEEQEGELLSEEEEEDLLPSAPNH